MRGLLADLCMRIGGQKRAMYQSAAALDSFERAHTLYKEWTSPPVQTANAAAWVGYVLWETGRYTESVRYLTEAIALQPNNSYYYYWRAAPYRSLGQVDQAVTDYQQAIERAGWSRLHESEVRLAMASLYCEMAQPELAQTEIERIRSLVPDVPVPGSCQDLTSRGDR